MLNDKTKVIDKYDIIIACLLLFVFLPIFTIINGFVVVYLWNWFVFPTFSNINLGLIQAMGLSLLIAFITQSTYSGISKDGVIERVTTEISRTLMVFVCGWILHFFLM